MNCFKTMLKLIVALAAIAGVVYVIAAHGEQIVAWFKKMMAKCSCCEAVVDSDEDFENAEVPAEAAEEVAEEAPAEAQEPIAADDNAPTADESDFVG